MSPTRQTIVCLCSQEGQAAVQLASSHKIALCVGWRVFVRCLSVCFECDVTA